jgi:formamidopyrimidine-DNA glycosylase
MPELPDVEVMKRYCDATALHQEVQAVRVRDQYVLKEITPQKLEKRLVGQSFARTRRHGKYLFVGLKDRPWLALHFGMTGHLKYFKLESQRPEYAQVLFLFRNEYRLAYVSARKLGQVRLIPDIDAFVAQQDLGPDVLDPDFDLDTFRRILADRRGMIKPALMDQSLMAGIGNVYADEILFQAGVYPRRKVSELDDDVLKKIFDALKEVLQTAIECQADPEQLPDSFLIPHRHEDGHCPHCGGQVRKIEISGRTGYYCPDCQS